MKKIFLNIYIFFQYLFHGMKAANDLIVGDNEAGDDGVNAENKIKNQKHTVCQDLLRGELTQEVIELRHEMYYAERESHKYEYAGGGRARKSNSLFGYNGKIENSDNLHVRLVQENEEHLGSVLYEFEKDKVRKFRFNFVRDFIPTMKIEEYLRKMVVFEKDGKYVLDFYFDSYERQFDRRSRMFINELERILGGDRRSQVIDVRELEFTTRNAYGADDGIVCRYKGLSFEKALTYDGHIILRYGCESEERQDILDEIYDERTAEKNRNHEARKENESTLDIAPYLGKDEDKTDEANELIERMREENVQRESQD